MKNLYQSCLKIPAVIKKLNSNPIRLSAGFSLIELIVSAGIIGLLSAIAFPIYSKYSTRAMQGRMQHEVADLKKGLAYAHSVDGGYHQKIYTAGYIPDEQLIAEVGFKYNRSDPSCCDLFDTGDFFTIKTQGASQLEKSTRASHICDESNPKKCEVDDDCVPPGVKNKKLTPTTFTGGCSSDFSGEAFVCDCEEYKIYAINKWKGKDMYMLADHKGRICASTHASADGTELEIF